MIQANLDTLDLDILPSVYFLMLDGCNLKTIAKKTGSSRKSIEKIIASWELEHVILTNTSLLEIYKIPNEADMESALEEYTENYKKYIFEYIDDYRKGFFYVGKKWVKKDQRGQVIERVERPTPQEIAKMHFDDEWFMNLVRKYESILNSYDGALIIKESLIGGGDNN